MSGVCFQFQRGECTRGDACRFSHSLEGGDAGGYAPRRTGGGGGACYAFQRGECDRGDASRFSHEAGGGGDVSGGGDPVAVGECDRGDACRFSHEAGGGGDVSGGGDYGYAPRRAAQTQGACYAFQRGECDRGSACRFSHDAGGAGGGGGAAYSNFSAAP
eukprot:CAMPEP_0173348582 /NCGR_PEP_ID=MMETSP1144-20121109/13818_1 /TAXON_ID=483371 /ORGANISM="non described non described, Strain CCMP2298" /LENGTH=159 /DNA_ID=CAMNT_0014296253 /DNA_START=43 /DNA_END=519 /DNA_ORIENTATION=-